MLICSIALSLHLIPTYSHVLMRLDGIRIDKAFIYYHDHGAVLTTAKMIKIPDKTVLLGS